MERLPKAGMGVPDGNHHHHNDCFFWEVYYDDWNIFPVLVASFAFVVFVACCVSSRVCFSSGTSDAWKAHDAQRALSYGEPHVENAGRRPSGNSTATAVQGKGRERRGGSQRRGGGRTTIGGKSDVVNVPLLP